MTRPTLRFDVRAVTLLLGSLFVASISLGQTMADPFVGTWSLTPSQEKELFHVQKVDNTYIVTFFGRYSTNLERLNRGIDWWTATASGAELIGDNKSRIRPVSKNELIIASFQFQGEDQHRLYRVQSFSKHFGVWQSEAKDGAWIKVFRGCDIGGDGGCKDPARCYTVLRNRNKPGETPYAITAACDDGGLVGKGIAISVVSNDKIKVNWPDQQLTDLQLSRFGPLFVKEALVIDSAAPFLGRWSEDGSTNSEVFTVKRTGSGYHIESSARFDGAKTEWYAQLQDGRLVGRPKDDGTRRDTVMRIVDGSLYIINLYGNNKTLRRVK